MPLVSRSGLRSAAFHSEDNMSDNKALWKRVFTTDPKAVKPITGKQYQGNSPKPYWIVERLTDEFGPCGIGWGFVIVSERIERFSDTDSLHIAVVRFWYVIGDKRGELEQIGQTKASYQSSSGKFVVDEDAPKKSVTDALVKCASYLGFAGDIFSGRWDDSKYVKEAAAEWEGRRREESAGPQQRPADISLGIINGVKNGDAVGAAEYLATLGQKELESIWNKLPADIQDKLTAAWPKAA